MLSNDFHFIGCEFDILLNNNWLPFLTTFYVILELFVLFILKGDELLLVGISELIFDIDTFFLPLGFDEIHVILHLLDDGFILFNLFFELMLEVIDCFFMIGFIALENILNFLKAFLRFRILNLFFLKLISHLGDLGIFFL